MFAMFAVFLDAESFYRYCFLAYKVYLIIISRAVELTR